MYMTTGEVIRRIRKSIGMTQTELGALLSFSQPAVSQLEHDGPASHDVRILRLVARALQVPLAILVVESDEEADVDRRQFFKTGGVGIGAAAVGATVSGSGGAVPASGVKVGASDVAAISESVTQLHELDLVVGGDRLCRLAAGQVRYVQQLLDTGSYTDHVGRQLTSASAEMMTAAGWVHYDAGRLDEARRYYADAAQAANVADDSLAAAHALGNASIIGGGTVAGTKQAVQYAEAASRAALRSGGPKLRALMAIREADALGMQGAETNRTAIRDALNRAHRAYESSRGHDPEWVYLPEPEFHGLTGMVQVWLGEHKGAGSSFTLAIDGSAAWPREMAEWHLLHAQNLVQTGDIAEGCSLLTDNMDTITSLASTRLHEKLKAIATEVRHHSGVPEVREFLGRVMANLIV